ncbi:hypothetical protein [Thermococcus sp.]|uniref:hypothetical protein n=1 Tax=Thermococcus sp. TaxID=35749 RepID=UPI0025D87680|nr:hypothetical protein [Thermococcus sp.]
MLIMKMNNNSSSQSYVEKMLGGITRDSAKIPRNIFSVLNLYGAIVPYSFIILLIYPKCQSFIKSFVSSFSIAPSLIYLPCIFLGYFLFSRLFFIPIIGHTRKIVKFTLVIMFVTSILALYKIFSLFLPLVFITIMSYAIFLLAFLMFKERGILDFGSLIIFYNVTLPIFSREFHRWLLFEGGIIYPIVSLLKYLGLIRNNDKPISKYLWSIIEFFAVTIFWIISISYLSETTLVVLANLGENMSLIGSVDISYSDMISSIAVIVVMEIVVYYLSINRILKKSLEIMKNNLWIDISLGESKLHKKLSEYLTGVITSLYSIVLLGKGNEEKDDTSVILVFLHLLGTTYEVICRNVKCVCENKKNKATEVRESRVFLYAFHEFIKIPLIIEKDSDWKDEINMIEGILKDQKMEKAGYISSLRKDILYPDSVKSWIEIKYKIYYKEEQNPETKAKVRQNFRTPS